MVRLTDVSEAMSAHLLKTPCPEFETTPWTPGPPLEERRIAIISTAALQRHSDPLLTRGATDYRIIPADTPAGDLIMAHNSSNFDRTGYQQDLNICFPLERLKELAREGVIGSIADYHYSVLGSTAPEKLDVAGRTLAGLLKKDGVDTVLLVPV
ncbi:MAG: glycine/sarcosine/betaine reductase selenoprotein B family protein [Rhodospirillales bacterium]